tara:strand:+ start:724 stop:1365 length:642 start_codon:yes stop_codon:yes gene_type:complete
MSRLNVDKITGATGTASGAPITLSGDTATLGSSVTGPSLSMHFISKATISGTTTSSIEFTSLGNHSSFKDLVFVLNGLTPTADNVEFKSQVAIDGTTYLTSNYYYVLTRAFTNLSSTNNDSYASSSAICSVLYMGNDGHISGKLTLYGHQSTTYRKSLIGEISAWVESGYINTNLCGGWHHNSSSDEITAIKFFYSTGYFASGSIAMYGIKDA